MTPEESTRLGRAWLEMGLGEHASVAAFARFVLHLLRLGAPPELLRGAIRAMDDEVVHTRICFGVAKRFTGKAAGPGPIDMSDVADQPADHRSIMEAAILEGCIAETISARYAQVAFERAEDRAIRTALARIAEDESRHADLSWRFVHWLLHKFPELNSAAAACFAQAFSTPLAFDEEEADPESFEKYGHLLPSSKRQVAHAVLQGEIAERTVALLGYLPSSNTPALSTATAQAKVLS